MQDTERPDFAEAMTRLFAVYGDELTDALLGSWWGVLQGFELREVRWGMSAHVKDTKAGRFKPTPADVIRQISEELPKHRRALKNQRLSAARDAVAPMEERALMLAKEIELGILRGRKVEEIRAEINGLHQKIGATLRENGIDDSTKMVWHPPSNTLALGGVIKELGYGDDESESDEEGEGGSGSE